LQKILEEMVTVNRNDSLRAHSRHDDTSAGAGLLVKKSKQAQEECLR
jgi:hypothetical protein